MSAFLFWIFALLMRVFGAGIIINRNPVASALSLVVSIMVLFLFIIMLLDLRAEQLRKINWVASGGGLAVALALMVQIFAVVGRLSVAKQTFPPLARSTTDDVHRIGLLLFDNYNLPFQIIGVVILVATIGAVMLSRRESR